jgi:phenylalanyl-tRNA synthetase alpha chain
MESYETHNFILRRLNESENEVIPNTLDIAAELSMEHQTLDAALKSLNVDDYI